MDSKLARQKETMMTELARKMAEILREEIPDEGPFYTRFILLEYPGCKHEGKLSIQHNFRYGCFIQASMYNAENGSTYVHNLRGDPREKCLDWFTDPLTPGRLVTVFDGLQQRADKQD